MIVRTSLALDVVRGLSTPGRGPRRIDADVVPVRPGVCEPAGSSRTHATRLDVLLVGNGRYRDGLGQYGPIRPRGGFSPQHDEYGDWCAALFALDPSAVVGPYRGVDAFLSATRYAYPVENYGPAWKRDAMDHRAWYVDADDGPSAWLDVDALAYDRAGICAQTTPAGHVHRFGRVDAPRALRYLHVPAHVIDALLVEHDALSGWNGSQVAA